MWVNQSYRSERNSWWGGHTVDLLTVPFIENVKSSFITPNVLTSISFALGIIAAALLYFDYESYRIISVLLIQVSYFFDCADGNMARKRRMSSDFGAKLDLYTDIVKLLLLISIIMMNVYITSGRFVFSLIYLLIFINTFRRVVVRSKRPQKLKANREIKTKNTFINSYIKYCKRMRLRYYPFDFDDQLYFFVLLVGLAFNYEYEMFILCICMVILNRFLMNVFKLER